VTKTSVLTALAVFAAVLLTAWVLGSIEGKPVRWTFYFVMGAALAIASLVGDYRRRKKAD